MLFFLHHKCSTHFGNNLKDWNRRIWKKMFFLLVFHFPVKLIVTYMNVYNVSSMMDHMESKVMCQIFVKLFLQNHKKKFDDLFDLILLAINSFSWPKKKAGSSTVSKAKIIYSSHRDNIATIKLKKVSHKTYYHKLCTVGWFLFNLTE